MLLLLSLEWKILKYNSIYLAYELKLKLYLVWYKVQRDLSGIKIENLNLISSLICIVIFILSCELWITRWLIWHLNWKLKLYFHYKIHSDWHYKLRNTVAWMILSPFYWSTLWLVRFLQLGIMVSSLLIFIILIGSMKPNSQVRNVFQMFLAKQCFSKYGG